MSDDKKPKNTQYDFLPIYKNYTESSIITGVLPTGSPEFVQNIPIEANRVFHQWQVNVHPSFVFRHETPEQLRWLIFQRIRHVGEILEGLFTVEEDDFKKIFNIFINEFFMHEIWVGCDPELLVMEKESLKRPGIIDRFCEEDILINSRFRLYRRFRRYGTKPGEEKWEYTSAISGIEGYAINTKKIQLVRCSFNRGLNFAELYNIFLSLETMLQHFNDTFMASGKKLVCRIRDAEAYKQELEQIRSPGVLLALGNKGPGKQNIWEPFDANTIEEAQMTYDLLMQKYNDDMARFGLTGDDDAKAERVTTGENYRALQPSASFQMGVISALKRCSLAFKDRLNETITFALGIVPTPQGIPQQYEFRHVKEERGNNEQNIQA